VFMNRFSEAGDAFASCQRLLSDDRLCLTQVSPGFLAIVPYLLHETRGEDLSIFLLREYWEIDLASPAVHGGRHCFSILSMRRMPSGGNNCAFDLTSMRSWVRPFL